MSDSAPAIALKDVVFRWHRRLPAVLEVPELTVPRGQRVFLYGPSGSGKTTLLNLLSGVNTPESGSVDVLGHRLTSLSGRQRDRFRARHIGIVFQQFNLIPWLSVQDNVQLARQFAGRSHASDEGEHLLHALGLSNELRRRPAHSLSMGQQQRVAVARALVNRPALLIADEPTSALDSDHRDEFLALLMDVASDRGSTILFVSHDRGLQHHFDRHLDMRSLQSGAAVQSGAAGAGGSA